MQILRGDAGEVILVGRFDASQADEAARVFDTLAGPSVLDCAGLDYISSMGLGVLLKTQKRLRTQGAGLKLVRVNRHIREILTYAGFHQIFEMESGDSP